MGNICFSQRSSEKYVDRNGKDAHLSLDMPSKVDQVDKGDEHAEEAESDEGSVESEPTAVPQDIRLNVQHISEREDLSNHPGTIFMEKFRDDKSAVEEGMRRKRRSMQHHHREDKPAEGSIVRSRKFSSCSTIYLDDNTVSQPNLKTTLKLVSLAVYYHCKNFVEHPRVLEIFDERAHPLSRDPVSDGYDSHYPEHREIYRFVKILFSSAQLTSECAIITLVYLERLLTYADIDMHPSNWKRIVLGAIMLASKVWDDQAVWNVDYCQILKDISVEDMNELERIFLEMLQYNINVDSSVYARYYFDLRALADANGFGFPVEALSSQRAKKLEALSSLTAKDFTVNLQRVASMDQLTSPVRVKLAMLS
eukprot:m.41354 g.41354  ORF g.41354 m.41354 type:complete len:366 (+) comp33142_c0_seq1:131-1228(+)